MNRSYVYRHREVGMSMLVRLNKRKKTALGALWIDYTCVDGDAMYRHFSKWFDSVYNELHSEGFLLANKEKAESIRASVLVISTNRLVPLPFD